MSCATPGGAWAHSNAASQYTVHKRCVSLATIHVILLLLQGRFTLWCARVLVRCALYLHDSANATVSFSKNATVIDDISECSTNIECLFLKTTKTLEPIIIGVVYRPNDGNIEHFYEKLNEIFEYLPKSNVFIMGDYNINLLSSTASSKFEESFLSGGFIPLISTYTHERQGTKKSSRSETNKFQEVKRINLPFVPL